KIGEVVATIDDSKEAPPEGAKEASKKKEPEEKKFVAAVGDRSQPAQRSAAEHGAPGSTTPAKTLSPAVRRIVEEEDIAPEKISGTGKDGRLTKGDVLAAAGDRKSVGEAVSSPGTATPSPTGQDRQSADGRFVRKRMSPLRRK